jgi:UDP-MurNAc hydroxylase
LSLRREGRSDPRGLRANRQNRQAMQLEFISNTGFYLEHHGVVFGMDIWLTQGPFEGSWFHYPPLRPTRFSVADCDMIYVSHIHPDHCDFLALSQARKDTSFIVPNYMNHLLARKLRSFGFEHIHSLAPGETACLKGGAKVRMYGAFVNNLFQDAAFGSLIDSAIVIEWDGRTILNCNDNYLTAAAAKNICKSYPDIDLALMPHSASGPYPASFRNLSAAEKAVEARQLQTRYIAHFVDMTLILNPRLVVPCAAEYVVVGRLHTKNRDIGLASSDEAVAAVNSLDNAASRSRAIRLDCGTVLNIDSGEISGLEARHFTDRERDAFAEARSDVPYPYDWEHSCNDPSEYDSLIVAARDHMWEIQGRLNWKRDYNVYICLDEAPAYHFNFADRAVAKVEAGAVKRKRPYLDCYLSRQLLYAILTRKAHWNNAEGGLHIDFHREPNVYVPEVFTLLSFLHRPGHGEA